MSFDHHVIVLTIPQGRAGGGSRLSVYFAPRLRRNGTLDDYRDWRNWAARTADFRYRVRTDAGDNVLATVVSRPASASTWNAVFKGSSARRVRAWTHVQRSEGRLTTSATHRMNALAEQMLRTSVLQNRATFTKAEMRTRFPGLGTTAQAIAPYFRTVGNGSTPSAGTLDLDFHAAVRMLGSHPALLRSLGLVVDLQVTGLSASAKEVRVEVEIRNGAPQLRSGMFVPTRMKLDASGFLPKSDVRGYSARRFLTVGSAAFDVAQIDASQMAGVLADLAGPLSDAEVADGDPIDLPAFSDGGIGVVHTGAKERMGRRFTSSARLETAVDDYIRNSSTNPIPTITYEDVVTGYRLDVRRGGSTTAPWRSVHRRRSTKGFEFPGDPDLTLAPSPDEGWARPSLSTDGTPVGERVNSSVAYGSNEKRVFRDTTRWRLSDLLVLWSGWSLSAPKPSATTTGTGEVESRGEQTNSPEYPARAIIDYTPTPGTLPSLRYGAAYRLRLRQVDLAGGGPRPGDASPSGADSEIVTFGRFAPVASPLVVRRKSRPDPGVGDEPTTIVILSEEGNPADPADRLVFPPSVAQSVVERHGLPGDGHDPAAYTDLVARDAASLSDQTIVDPDTNEPVAGAALVDGRVTEGPLKPAVLYLSDPMASGVAGIDLPGQIGTVSMSHGTWPTLEAVRLQLADGTGAPVLDTANRTITVFLPPGTTHDCRVAHTLPDDRLLHMRGFQLLTPEERTARRNQIRQGRNEGISRSRSVRLVHAVRQPVEPPSFSVPLVGTRPADGTGSTIGQTLVTITGTVGVHRATSDHIALSAVWNDSVDDLAQAEPGTVSGSAYIGDLVVPEDGDADSFDLSAMTIDMSDTRHRTLVVSSEAFSRYARYFTDRRRVRAVDGETTVLDAAGISATDIEVRNRNTDRVFQNGVDYSVDPLAGSVTIIATGDIPVDAPLEIRYLARPFSRLSSEAATGPTTTVVVPSTVAPDPPLVRTVVPAFQRTETNTSTRRQVEHDGRVVRVLLERPWYSSGDDEKLAVVVDPSGALDSGATVWGRDPIITAGGSLSQPTLESFPLASSTDDLVDGGTMDAAVHDVAYDTSRDIWTSDVLVDSLLLYRPFVQLAVARYQPVAVDGAHMSTTETCVAARLGVQRTVTVDTTGSGEVSVTVVGVDSGANTVRVVLQEDNGASSDPLFRWQDVTSVTATRTGPASEATFTVSALSTVVAGNPSRRLLIEESEPVDVQSGATTVDSSMVVYRELVTLPSGW